LKHQVRLVEADEDLMVRAIYDVLNAKGKVTAFQIAKWISGADRETA